VQVFAADMRDEAVVGLQDNQQQREAALEGLDMRPEDVVEGPDRNTLQLDKAEVEALGKDTKEPSLDWLGAEH